MAKTLTIRLSDEQSSHIVEVMKRDEGLKTASKTVLRCLRDYLPLVDRLHEQEEEIVFLRDRIKVMNTVITDSRNAALALVEKVGQFDIFEKELEYGSNPEMPPKASI